MAPTSSTSSLAKQSLPDDVSDHLSVSRHVSGPGRMAVPGCLPVPSNLPVRQLRADSIMSRQLVRSRAGGRVERRQTYGRRIGGGGRKSPLLPGMALNNFCKKKEGWVYFSFFLMGWGSSLLVSASGCLRIQQDASGRQDASGCLRTLSSTASCLLFSLLLGVTCRTALVLLLLPSS